MIKVAHLRLEGSLSEGIKAFFTVQGIGIVAGICQDPVILAETIAALPPAPHLAAILDQWRSSYNDLRQYSDDPRGLRIRALSHDKQEALESNTDLLLSTFHSWLNDDLFRPVHDQWLQLTLHEEIQINIRSSNKSLFKLPWQEWRVFDQNVNSGIAFGTPDIKAKPKTSGPMLRGPIKILAIFGDSTGINLQADYDLLHKLVDAGASLTFLASPDRNQINHQLWEQDWDILFFAGHSYTHGEGRICINANQSLSIQELRYALQKAINSALQLAIFNSCDGFGLAFALQDLRIPQTVVMQEPVPDYVAQEFLRHFLEEFINQQSFYLAVRKARERLQGLEDRYPCASWLPTIFQSDDAFAVSWDRLGYRPTTVCPYQGLSAFSESDVQFFFGREQFTSTLSRNLKVKSFIGVVGASGSGKSSVVFAGLIPLLRQEGWQIVTVRPGKQAIEALEDLLESIRHDPAEVDTKDLLLYIDQFEELYSQDKKGGSREFIDKMLQCVEMGHVSVLITLRADFLNEALSYTPLAKLLAHSIHALGAMNAEDLRAIVEKPAAALGVRLENGLVEELVKAGLKSNGNLCVLEFVLESLWAKLQGNRMSYAAYQALGGLEQAITRHAERIFFSLSHSEQQQARRVLLQLISPLDNEINVRRIATRADIGDNDWTVVQKLAAERLLVATGEINAGSERVELVHEALIQEWPRLRQWVTEHRDFRRWQDKIRKAATEWRTQRKDKGFLLRGKALADSEEWLKTHRQELANELDFINAGIKQRRHTYGYLLSGLAAAIVLAVVAGIGWLRASNAVKDGQINYMAFNAQKYYALSHQGREKDASTKDEDYQKQDKFFKASILTAIKAGQAALQENGLTLETRLKLVSSLRQAIKEQLDKKEEVHFPDCKSLQRGPVALVQDVGSGIVVCVNYDSTVRIFDGVTGKILKTFPGEVSWVDDLAFSPDNKWILTGTTTGNVNVWDGKTNQLVRTLAGGVSQISAISLSPDGKMIAGASYDGTVRMWDLDNPKALQKLEGFSKEGDAFNLEVTRLAFGSQGQVLVTVNREGTVKLWDWRAGRLLRELKSQGIVFNNEKVKTRYLGLTPEGNTMVYALSQHDKPQNIVFQTLQEGMVLRTLTIPPGEVFISPDAKVIALIDKRESDIKEGVGANFTKQIVSLWDAEKGLKLGEIKVPGVPSEISFSPDGKLLAVYSYSHDSKRLGPDQTQPGRIMLWRTDGHHIATLEQLGEIQSMVFSPDGHILAANSFGEDEFGYSNVLKIWDASDGKLLNTLLNDPIGFSGQGLSTGIDIGFSPDGSTLAAVFSHGIVQLFDTAIGATISTPDFNRAHDIPAISPKCQQSNKGCYKRKTDGEIIKYDDIGQEKLRMRRYDSVLFPAAYINKQKQIITTVNWHGMLVERSLETGDIARKLQLAFDQPVSHIAFSPNGKQVVSIMLDESLRLWDVDTGRDLKRFNEAKQKNTSHDWRVASIRFNRDGSKLATLSWPDSHTQLSRLNLWDVVKGEKIKLPEEEYNNFDINPDGTEIALIRDNALQIWNIASGKQMKILKSALSDLKNVFHSDDGHLIYLLGYHDLKIIDHDTTEEIASFEVNATSPSSLSLDLEKQILMIQDGDTIKSININIHDLLKENCGPIRRYLEESTDLNEADKKICENF